MGLDKSAVVFIIIPTYNEEEDIERVINNLLRNSTNEKYRYEIIVVNDGSRDATYEILSKREKSLTLINHKENLGIGRVFKSGFNRINLFSSANDIVVVIEADNTNDLSILNEMIEKVKQGNDIVIASRLIKGGRYVGFPIIRRVISIIGNKILRIICPINGINDYTIFYRAYSANIVKEALKNYNNCFEFRGFASNTEILLKLSRLTSKVCEVPLIYRYDFKKSKSKFRLIYEIFEYIILIYRYLFNCPKPKTYWQPQKVHPKKACL